MKKGKVHSVGDELFEKCSKRVIIHRDRFPPNPLEDYDQVFLLHSNIDDFSGNENDKDYQNPLVEIEDEDGYGTGEYRPKDGVIAFAVSAYIHSGIALKLGTIMCFFGDTVLPGCRCGCDTTPKAGFMWTTKERFEKMCGPWMEIWDEEARVRRMAKDEDEFRKYLEKLAEGELELFQKYIDGDCYWYETEVKRKFTKVYENGEKVEGHEWEDGGDSCGGFYVDKVGDIDFPKEEGWSVFADDDCSNLVGDEFNIPEYVVVKYDPYPTGTVRFFLRSIEMDESGKVTSSVMTPLIEEAKTFSSWYAAQSVAQDVISKDQYDVDLNIKEIDDLSGKPSCGFRDTDRTFVVTTGVQEAQP